MRAVDTNVLVRLFVANDPKQTAWAKNFIGAGAWISHLVLAETIWVLTSFYAMERKRIVLAVETLLSNNLLTVQDRETVADALLLFRSKRGVDFSDCLILTTARRHGHAPLGTFDAKLARLDGTQRIGSSDPSAKTPR